LLSVVTNNEKKTGNMASSDQHELDSQEIRKNKRRKKKLRRHRLSQTKLDGGENTMQQQVDANSAGNLQNNTSNNSNLYRISQQLVQQLDGGKLNEPQQEADIKQDQQLDQQQAVLHVSNKLDAANKNLDAVAQSQTSVRSRVQFLKDKMLPKQEPVAMHRHFTFNATRGVVAVPLKTTLQPDRDATNSSGLPPPPIAAVEPEAVVVIEYTKDPLTVVSRTEQFLQRYLKSTATAAADYYCVFDVDDTMMFGTDDLISVHPLGRVLYDMCARLGFDIAVITARSGTKASVAYLRDQLSILGYTGYTKVCMASSEHQNDASPALCKVMSRRELGKPVILNVGNLTSDLFLMCDSDSVLANLNPHTYYFLKGHDPDILCLKLPTY
jgi:hypothetical protein